MNDTSGVMPAGKTSWPASLDLLRKALALGLLALLVYNTFTSDIPDAVLRGVFLAAALGYSLIFFPPGQGPRGLSGPAQRSCLRCLAPLDQVWATVWPFGGRPTKARGSGAA